MGCHTSPQFYLKGFAQQGSPLLWVYERGNHAPRLLPIRSIAQERHFYSETLESYLANNIEMPANRILRNIRNQKPISPNEKKILSEYIYIFYKRVPRALRRFHENAPKIADDLMKNINSNLDKLKYPHPKGPDDQNNLRVKVQTILDNYKESPPKDIWQKTIPINYLKASILLSRMNWIFFICEEPDLFVTSDNPVFIHPELGINKVGSELTFPISKNISLLANWWKMKDLSYVEAKSSVIKEMNRRVALNATRFMYCHVQREWVTELLNKKNHQITLIDPPKKTICQVRTNS